jgi:hypothetical protein
MWLGDGYGITLSEHVDIGAAGHIDSVSRIGAWPEGYALLERLRSPRPHNDDINRDAVGSATR